MSINPDDYAANARRADSVLTAAMESWKNGLDFVTSQFRAVPSFGNLPHVDATEAVERQFAFIQQIVELNHQYARQLAEVANTLTGATRQQLGSVSGAVRDQVQSVADTARSNVDNLQQTVRDTERQERKQARDTARERYQSLTKNELADEAGKRDLPKTGTVDELVDRLVTDDTK
jgi:gas vesicle protein